MYKWIKMTVILICIAILVSALVLGGMYMWKTIKEFIENGSMI